MAVAFSVTPTVSGVLGIFAVMLIALELIPQALLNRRLKSAVDLAPSTVLVWMSGREVLAVYSAFTLGRATLLMENLMYSSMAMVLLWQYMVYNHSWLTTRQSTAIAVVVFVAMHGAAAGLYVAMTFAEGTQYDWIVLVAGAYPPAAFFVGFVPHYTNMFVHRQIVGISIPTVALDMLAAVVSIIALATDTFDALAALSFIIIVAMQAVVLAIIGLLKRFPRPPLAPAVKFPLTFDRSRADLRATISTRALAGPKMDAEAKRQYEVLRAQIRQQDAKEAMMRRTMPAPDAVPPASGPSTPRSLAADESSSSDLPPIDRSPPAFFGTTTTMGAAAPARFLAHSGSAALVPVSPSPSMAAGVGGGGDGGGGGGVGGGDGEGGGGGTEEGGRAGGMTWVDLSDSDEIVEEASDNGGVDVGGDGGDGGGDGLTGKPLPRSVSRLRPQPSAVMWAGGSTLSAQGLAGTNTGRSSRVSLGTDGVRASHRSLRSTGSQGRGGGGIGTAPPPAFSRAASAAHVGTSPAPAPTAASPFDPTTTSPSPLPPTATSRGASVSPAPLTTATSPSPEAVSATSPSPAPAATSPSPDLKGAGSK